MANLGDFALESTFDFKFCTVQATGAPTTLAGSPVVSIYPGNSTTQLTAGITLSVDFDSVTGLNNVRVVATAANGYAADTNYAVVITTGTVNSVSAVGYVVGHFSIENRVAPTQTDLVAAVFARAFPAAYGSYTFDELVKQFAAVLLGKASGLAGTTATYRNLADSGDVVVATVDADGNRTSVSRTP